MPQTFSDAQLKAMGANPAWTPEDYERLTPDEQARFDRVMSGAPAQPMGPRIGPAPQREGPKIGPAPPARESYPGMDTGGAPADFGPVRAGLAHRLGQMAPIAAGAASMHPALGFGAKLATSFGAPAATELGRQFVEDEEPNAGRAAMEGALSLFTSGGGGLARTMGPKWGRQILRNEMPVGGIEETERLVNLLLKYKGQLTPEDIERLQKGSNAAMIAGTKPAAPLPSGKPRTVSKTGRQAISITSQGKLDQARDMKELAELLQKMDSRGGAEPPFISLMKRSGGSTSGRFASGGGMFTPAGKIKFGSVLAGPVGRAAPPTIEGMLRALLASIHADREPPPRRGEEPPY